MTDTEVAQESYSIGDLAQSINRSETTIRVWCREGRLPEHLRPARIGAKGWRRWSDAQVQEIKSWMVAERMFPGGGLPYYNPSASEQDAVLDKLRSGKKETS